MHPPRRIVRCASKSVAMLPMLGLFTVVLAVSCSGPGENSGDGQSRIIGPPSFKMVDCQGDTIDCQILGGVINKLMAHPDSVCRNLGRRANTRYNAVSYGYRSSIHDPQYDPTKNPADMWSYGNADGSSGANQNIYWKPGYFGHWSSDRERAAAGVVSHEEFHFVPGAGLHPTGGDWQAPNNYSTRCQLP